MLRQVRGIAPSLWSPFASVWSKRTHSGSSGIPIPPCLVALQSAEETAQAREWIGRFGSVNIPKSSVDLFFSRSSGPGGQVAALWRILGQAGPCNWIYRGCRYNFFWPGEMDRRAVAAPETVDESTYRSTCLACHSLIPSPRECSMGPSAHNYDSRGCRRRQ
ncbi:hypothetical protein C8J57DRAFT_398790 [Mycena rebaudengoi]|nr:hypothetical protein C8J57DRAFT_398790 [Mycena rebaudengoi]